ncbi:hypothetical protein ABE587_16635 [[Pseudomonas] hibiscicola]|uniref:Uncharacterized protein n=1 Tax=Stenotrophomonas hibiscicola TaxID=86189 RepID=A0ABV0CAQ1_9GAMM|nr:MULTISPECIES: hypothetical protein [Stenotrophomonas]MDQ7310880.1 hypothetical protein [Stenotrophomonas sp. Sm10]HDX0835659.1 hypothetical protein [Stenotrophomonas maltophilia]
MVRILGCALMVSFSVMAHAAPDALEQLNFPVTALGETAELRLRLAPHPGGLVTYSIHTNVYASEENSGYRVLDVRCPPGFLSNVYRGNTGAVCYRVEETPHPAGEMSVVVFNENAPDGHLEWAEGLWSLDASGPPVKTSWHLFGVRP